MRQTHVKQQMHLSLEVEVNENFIYFVYCTNALITGTYCKGNEPGMRHIAARLNVSTVLSTGKLNNLTIDCLIRRT